MWGSFQDSGLCRSYLGAVGASFILICELLGRTWFCLRAIGACSFLLEGYWGLLFGGSELVTLESGESVPHTPETNSNEPEKGRFN